jgi:hypothetical protein
VLFLLYPRDFACVLLTPKCYSSTQLSGQRSLHQWGFPGAPGHKWSMNEIANPQSPQHSLLCLPILLTQISLCLSLSVSLSLSLFPSPSPYIFLITWTAAFTDLWLILFSFSISFGWFYFLETSSTAETPGVYKQHCFCFNFIKFPVKCSSN